MKVLGIIPARYQSQRFPGKPLVDLLGKPMIQHVVEQANQSSLLSKVVVATDDQRIADCVMGFNSHVIMTATDHNSGTSRCGEVISKLDESFDYVINIQGDEPLIQPSQIDSFSLLFNQSNTNIATLARPITHQEEIESKHVVKVVRNQENNALYFSRSIIPFNRSNADHTYLQHIGIYAYRTETLKEIVQLKSSPLEIAESLEQLRWLDNGYAIKVGITHDPTFAIDSPDDVNKVIQQMRKNGKAY